MFNSQIFCCSFSSSLAQWAHVVSPPFSSGIFQHATFDYQRVCLLIIDRCPSLSTSFIANCNRILSHIQADLFACDDPNNPINPSFSL